MGSKTKPALARQRDDICAPFSDEERLFGTDFGSHQAPAIQGTGP